MFGCMIKKNAYEKINGKSYYSVTLNHNQLWISIRLRELIFDGLRRKYYKLKLSTPLDILEPTNPTKIKKTLYNLDVHLLAKK